MVVDESYPCRRRDKISVRFKFTDHQKLFDEWFENEEKVLGVKKT